MDRLVDQFGAYGALAGVHVNGRETQGENIADLGGLLLARDAYHLSLKAKAAPMIDGLSAHEPLFLRWAQTWRNRKREDTARERVLSDVHSPARFRSLGPVRNIDASYNAFGVKPGDRNYLPPDGRVRIG